MLSDEQATQIKQQILQQIEASFPEESKAQAKAQLEAMNNEQLEQFLQQNNMIKDENSVDQSGQQCVFCSIIAGNIQSTKLEENASAIAILEINPISQGHTMVLPKEHSEEVTPKAEELAEKISNLLKKKLKPKQVITAPSKLFGHAAINVIPVYDNETIESPRHQATKEELESTLQKILTEPKKPIKKSPPKKIKEKLWLPKRIP